MGNHWQTTTQPVVAVESKPVSVAATPTQVSEFKAKELARWLEQQGFSKSVRDTLRGYTGQDLHHMSVARAHDWFGEAVAQRLAPYLSAQTPLMRVQSSALRSWPAPAAPAAPAD